MEGVDKLRSDIGKKYDALCEELKVARHNKLYFNLIEPVGDNNPLSVVYRGNYKMYFTDRVKDEDFEILCEALMENAELVTHIDFSFNELTSKSMPKLGKFIREAVKLESLNLQYNNIGSEGCQIILDAFTKARWDEEEEIWVDSTLIYLNLEGNDIKSEGILGIEADSKLFKDEKSKIETFLSNNKDLIELNLSNNKIDELGIIEIVSQFNSDNNSTVLEVLCLDNPYFVSPSQTSSFHIGRMLQSKYCPIQKLSLRKNNLNDENLFVICDHLVLKDESKLRVLDIGANKITYKGCQSLVNVLKAKNCVLESLIMNNNRTGYFGARAISEAIEKNKTLVHLDMTTNDITDDGLYIIAQALKKNDTLFSVKLYYNHFGDRARKEFYELLREENPARTSDWFLDFTIYKVDEVIQIAYVDNALPYDIYVPRKYFINTN